jgi:DNA-binding CsgD family transcriptional regulator
MIFRLTGENAAMIFIAVNRQTWGFSERDKQIANLLRLHFVAAYNNALAFTKAEATLALADQSAGANADAGFIVIDAHGQVLHANTTAVELIRKYFSGTAWGKVLPQPVIEWLVNDTASGLPATSLQEISDGQRLMIRWMLQPNGSKLLLLKEEAAADENPLTAAGLSRREAEVLHWIAEGKSNIDIGRVLGISVRTVEKHVEAVYRKLGVETRTAAVLRVFSQARS